MKGSENRWSSFNNSIFRVRFSGAAEKLCTYLVMDGLPYVEMSTWEFVMNCVYAVPATVTVFKASPTSFSALHWYSPSWRINLSTMERFELLLSQQDNKILVPALSEITFKDNFTLSEETERRVRLYLCLTLNKKKWEMPKWVLHRTLRIESKFYRPPNIEENILWSYLFSTISGRLVSMGSPPFSQVT